MRSLMVGGEMKSSGEAAAEMEFQAKDGAWYSIRLKLKDEGLIVSYCHFSPDANEVFKPTQFASHDHLFRFARRFRPLSLQVQDEDCHSVLRSMRVLAACHSGPDDVRFYEALVDEVERGDHRIEEGKEECCCKLLLHWQEGPKAGNLTCGRVADICLLQSTAATDPTLESFLERAMELIEKTSSKSNASAAGSGPGR